MVVGVGGRGGEGSRMCRGGLVHNTIWDCGEHYNTIIESDRCGHGVEGWRTARVGVGEGDYAHAYAVIIRSPHHAPFLSTDSEQEDVSAGKLTELIASAPLIFSFH